jgi:SHO1 osmosensor
MFCLITGIIVVLIYDSASTYYIAIIGFLAAGLILTSSSVNDLIYTSNRVKNVAAAGFASLFIANVYTIMSIIARISY